MPWRGPSVRQRARGAIGAHDDFAARRMVKVLHTICAPEVENAAMRQLGAARQTST